MVIQNLYCREQDGGHSINKSIMFFHLRAVTLKNQNKPSKGGSVGVCERPHSLQAENMTLVI